MHMRVKSCQLLVGIPLNNYLEKFKQIPGKDLSQKPRTLPERIATETSSWKFLSFPRAAIFLPFWVHRLSLNTTR